MTELDNIIQDWRNKTIETSYDLEVKLSNYRILFAYNSNAIEGSTVSLHQTREIFENGKLINFTGDTSENLDGFVAFMKDQLIKTWANNTSGKNRKLNI